MRVCKHCHTSFERPKGRSNRYCSPHCYHAANARTPKFEPVEAVCQQAFCGKTFTQTHWLQRYCCDECYQIRRRVTDASRDRLSRKDADRRARMEKILKKHGLAS